MVWKSMNNVNPLKKKYEMIQKIFITAIALMLSFTGLQAQGVCTIKGSIDRDTLRMSKQQIKKVYLTRLDEYDRSIVVDSAKVKKGKFEFKRTLAADEPVLIYLLTGFDNGSLPVFVEPGIVEIAMKDAAYPMGALVKGTKTNDLYNEYKAINERCKKEQIDTLRAMETRMGKEQCNQWMDSEEGTQEWMRIGASALLTAMAEHLQFVLDHNDSPLAPLMLEREIYFNLSNEYAKQMLQSLSPVLKGHPYYRSYSNVVRALDLKVGGELPDISIPQPDGTSVTLDSFRGKYVLLDFWASWCAPCRKEIPYLVQLFNDTKDMRDKFTIISFSIDTKEKDWKDAIAKLGMNLDGWVHGSDLLGWQSPHAKMMGVTAVPKAILIDPEGKAISFTLRGEELVRRVKQILGGDLYYQRGGEDKK